MNPPANPKHRRASGFTLAEVLIVVAIIAVLVAVGAPVFFKQLATSRQGTDLANLRAAYAMALSNRTAANDDAGEAETQVMQHSGGFNLLDQAIIGENDLQDAAYANEVARILKGYCMIVRVDREGRMTLYPGDGGKLTGTTVSASEKSLIDDGAVTVPQFKSIDGNVLTYSVTAVSTAVDITTDKTLVGTYGVPGSSAFECDNVLYKWDGAHWNVASTDTAYVWQRAD